MLALAFAVFLVFHYCCCSLLFLASACFSWVLPAFSLLLLAWHAFTLSYSNCNCFYGFLVCPCLIVVFAAHCQACLVFHSFCCFVVCLLFFVFPFVWFDSSHACSCSCCYFCFSLLFWRSCFSSRFLASACFSWVLPAFSLLLLAWHTFTLSYSNCSCFYGFHVYPCLIVVFAALSQACLVFHPFCCFVCLLLFAFPFLWFDSSHVFACFCSVLPAFLLSCCFSFLAFPCLSLQCIAFVVFLCLCFACFYLFSYSYCIGFAWFSIVFLQHQPVPV